MYKFVTITGQKYYFYLFTRNWVCFNHLSFNVSRNDDISIYREGVTTDKGREEDKCLVNIGLHKYFTVPMSLNPGIRVTVKLREGYEFQGHRDSSTTGEIVSPAEPRTKAGMV